ncbi:Atrial natriuretic peptide receptor 2 [Hypsibius exemplaris]|uniref:Guanylate cyclase n=1 Tax=Hypsibius exemplaris TaxID=2072580 RepID=A0A9X6NBY5_HYPEX|nr:Atrial natriuretic peptide receptor 2 [Hypsibius exemplaris]
MQRFGAAVDYSTSLVNKNILADHSLRIRIYFQSTGPSCSKKLYRAAQNLYTLLQSRWATCHVSFGAGCPTTASTIYGIAASLNILFFGIPASGIKTLTSLDGHGIHSVESNLPNLMQTGFEFADLADCMAEFLDQYNYTHVVLLRDDAQTFFYLLSKNLLTTFKHTHDDLFAGTVEVPFFSTTATTGDYEKILRDANDHARVIALFMHARVIREFLLIAYRLGYTNGDYVFIAVELFDLKYWGKISHAGRDITDEAAREAYRSLLVFSLHVDPATKYDEEFQDNVKLLAKRHFNYTFDDLEKLDPILISAYQTLVVYAQEVVKMKGQGVDYYNGTLVSSRIRGNLYHTSLGRVVFDEFGQRDVDYDIKTFDDTTGKFRVFMTYSQHPLDVDVVTFNSSTFSVIRDIHWPNTKGILPADEPHCGFRNDKCLGNGLTTSSLRAAVAMPLLFGIALVTAGIYLFLKFRKLHAQFNPNWWKIPVDLVIVKQDRSNSVTQSRKSLNSRSTIGTSGPSGYSSYMCDILASYQNTLVMLTDVSGMKKHIDPDLAAQVGLLKSLSQITNLQRFIGIAVSPQNTCEFIIAEMCAKGSLTDILHNETFKLDWSFKNSLIRDTVFGMTQIHTSPVVSHGNLNSHTCLIDSRFTLKITDYGLPFFRKRSDLAQPKLTPDEEQQRNYEFLLWRAPELLRQRGDVYSFAIILQQIILRSGPFELPGEPLELSNREIIQEIINSNIPPVRPRVPRASCSNELYDLMERCWEEIPLERPTFPKIKDRLKRVVGEIGDNIVDVLFRRMEQYAAELETKVVEKTQQFMDEKNRSEQLLGELLPKSVASALMRGEHIDPEAYESVTIYFSDIVGFTTISAAGTPMDVVALLNGLYTFFDSILEKYDVYKVETIGDAYMVSSGLPVRNGNKHASEIAKLSLTLVESIADFVVPNSTAKKLEIRIGINSGRCVAGIVGMKMPRYCLFGDTVNVASRMESTGEPMKIQISQSTKDLLDSISGFHIVERGEVPVKGKGVLRTFWLLAVAVR